MDTKTYMKNALVTEPGDIAPLLDRMRNPQNARLLHAAMGLTTESGELFDALKRHLVYGKPLDRTNFIEEAGDIMWYLALLLDTVHSDFDEAMEKNVAKLKARFGEKFTEAAALERNLEKEREALER